MGSILKLRKTGVIIILIVIIFLLGFFAAKLVFDNPFTIHNGFYPNHKFIEGLYDEVNLSDSKEVFSYVFSSLDDEVTMYPSENYYYFTFPAHGKTIWGSMALPAHNRDDGFFGFGYVEKVDKTRQLGFPVNGGGGKYGTEDGVIVKKVNDFKYQVTFEGKTVVFHLYNIGLDPPQKAKLTGDEIYVGPGFDESGLKFFLIFNGPEQHLYWILNEDGFVPETFAPYTEDIVIGDRTEFAFYLDEENNRKIMVGVEGLNVLQNNWYDGPFDQMPDNYVYTGQIETQPYIEAAYRVKGRIDKYGNYLDENGTRVAVAPYYVYFSKEDLFFIDYCMYSNLTKSEFYSCITTQVFNVPEELYEKMYQ